MPVYNGPFLHRIPESYELCLTTGVFSLPNIERSVDFMMYKPKVLLTAVGSVSELITCVRIQGLRSTKFHCVNNQRGAQFL